MTKINLAIVDDHKLFREGMTSLLKEYDEISVNIEAENGVEFFKELNKKKKSVDIVLLDVEMPEMDGFQVLKKLKMAYPEIKALILTMHNEDELIYSLVSLGAKGLLQKSADIDQVVDAIHNVNAGELFFNEEVSQRVMKKLVKREHIKRTGLNNTLSEREREIIRLICDQLTSKEIAEKLYLSERTIEAHKRLIFEKTRSKNSAGVVLYAMRTGLID